MVAMATSSSADAEGSEFQAQGVGRADHALIGVEKRVGLGVTTNGEGRGRAFGV